MTNMEEKVERRDDEECKNQVWEKEKIMNEGKKLQRKVENIEEQKQGRRKEAC